MKRKVAEFEIGDRVAYSASFLKSTGQRTGDTPFLRGEIVSVEPFGGHQLCTIRWELRGKPYPVASQYHDDGLGRVISPNLTTLARLAADSALAG
jgi:hypothetical protein